MPIANDQVELDLGTIDGRIGQINVTLVIMADGTAHVRLFAHDPTSRRGGEGIYLGIDGLKELFAMTDHIRATVDRLQGQGQIRALASGHFPLR